MLNCYFVGLPVVFGLGCEVILENFLNPRGGHGPGWPIHGSTSASTKQIVSITRKIAATLIHS